MHGKPWRKPPFQQVTPAHCWEFLKNRRVSLLDAGFFAYIVIILLWQVWGLPSVLARLTLFDRVLETRSFLSLGIASYVLVRRASKAERTVLAIGRLSHEQGSLNLAEIRQRAATLGGAVGLSERL